MNFELPSLTVLIAVAGRAELLARTLASIAACEKPAAYRGTLVVENGPPAGALSVVRSFASQHRIEYRHVEQPGKCRALNAGVATIGSGLVVFTDDDVRVSRQWLVRHAEAAARFGPGHHFGGPVEIDAEHGLPPAWMRRYYPLSLAEPWSIPDCPAAAVVPGRRFMGTNWSAFAEEIISAGGFDPRLGPGTAYPVGDETDVQRRLERGGSRPVYVPDCPTWHYLHAAYLDRAWLVRRTHQQGVAWGIAQTRDRGPFVRATVHGALKGLVVGLKAGAWRLMGGEKGRLAADHALARWRGRWEGLWRGRSWPVVRWEEPAGRREAA